MLLDREKEDLNIFFPYFSLLHLLVCDHDKGTLSVTAARLLSFRMRVVLIFWETGSKKINSLRKETWT